MKIHKEGYVIIGCTAAIIIIVSTLMFIFIPITLASAFAVVGFLFLLFVLRFFRVPNRILSTEEGTVFSPADGRVVVIEETEENEYLKCRCRQVSVFMSVWNVHINWFPVGGEIKYFRHHDGKYLVAWHPKSSEENERTTTVVVTNGQPVLFRQIAGYVARRIVSYAKEGEIAHQNTQCGFIKFGSRVDIFLPLEAEILVNLNEKVIGATTIIARLDKKPITQ